MKPPEKLMNKNFFLLWQGQFVSTLGSQAFSIAMMLWVKHATGSASLMGFLMMFTVIPVVILAPIGGAFADRYSRRSIIILCDILRGLAVLTLAGLFFFMPDRKELIIASLFIVSIFLSINYSFFRPAFSAAIPDLVPEDKVPGANSLTGFSERLCNLAGQGAGGILYRVLGTPVLFLIDGLTYIFSAASEFFIEIPQKIVPEESKKNERLISRFKTEIWEGLAFVRNTRGMICFFLAIISLNFFLVPVYILLPFYVEDFLKAGPEWYGYLLAIKGLGDITGYFIAGTLKSSEKKMGFLLFISFLVGTAGCGFIGFTSVPTTALFIMFISGVALGFIEIIVRTVLQLKTPSEIRGRVFGLFSTLCSGLTPLGMGLAGVVADLTGQNIPLIYIICGFTGGMTCIIAFLNRDFRMFLVNKN